MALKRYIKLTLIFALLSSPAYAREVLTGFEDKDLVVLNEEQHRQDNNIDGMKSNITSLLGRVTAIESSDKRIKDIKGDFSKGLKEVLQLTPVTYNWNKLSGLNTSELQAGLIAQDVEKIIPEAVENNQTGYLKLSDKAMIAVLVNAIKEQQMQIDELKSQIRGVE